MHSSYLSLSLSIFLYIYNSACSEAGLVGGAEGEINGNGDDGDNIEPIRIYEECPFTYSEESKYSPCEVCGDTFIIDEPLSVECENSITNHCKEYYKLDQDACTDFPEIIIGGDCDYNKLPQSAVQALELGIKQGRNGKGIVFVFASGNDFIKGDDVNFSGWTNSRFTITVGAIGKNGLHADYSTPGSALVVSAPGGGTKDVGHLMTAGLGVNQCADSGQGTSFACPVVSGVIALMLEARTELSWRDVSLNKCLLLLLLLS
jgi:kexin